MAMTEKPGLSKAIPKETTAEARAPARPTPTSREMAEAMMATESKDKTDYLVFELLTSHTDMHEA